MARKIPIDWHRMVVHTNGISALMGNKMGSSSEMIAVKTKAPNSKCKRFAITLVVVFERKKHKKKCEMAEVKQET